MKSTNTRSSSRCMPKHQKKIVGSRLLKKCAAGLTIFFFLASAGAQTVLDPLSEEADKAFQNEHFDKALALYNQLIQEFPERKEGYFNRGLCLYNLDRQLEAILDFDEAKTIDLNLQEADYMKGLALEKSNRLSEALTLWQQLIPYFNAEQKAQHIVWAQRWSRQWYYITTLMILLVTSTLILSLGLRKSTT